MFILKVHVPILAASDVVESAEVDLLRVLLQVLKEHFPLVVPLLHSKVEHVFQFRPFEVLAFLVRVRRQL